MDPSAPETRKLISMVEEQRLRLERDQSVIADGFALAFRDATGFDPRECEMVVEQAVDSEYSEDGGSHKMIQRIYFQKRRKA